MDLVDDLDAIINTIHSKSPSLPIHAVNSNITESVRQLMSHFRGGETLSVVGPPGSGKATLINALVSQGREMERHSEGPFGLILLAGGACLLDTPGIRNLRIWIMEEGLEDAFPDIDALAKNCRFKDCGHMLEPGCAVIAAVESGSLDRQRLKSFRRLQVEAARERQGLENDPPAAKPSLWDSFKKRMGGN
jgi:ribosome biogenesis GTPase